MNSIKEIARINQRELELGVTLKGSWHDEYKDSAYVFVGGISFDMTEGDVLTVFSQFGEIIDINMPRDKETGKPRGFAFLMYEDQRSTVLAVDNMNGAVVLGRTVRCDHVRKYQQPGQKDEDGKYQPPEEPTYNAMPPELSGSETSSAASDSGGSDVDDEDPMAAFLRAEKRKEREAAGKKGKGKSKRIKADDGESKEEKRAKKEAKRKRKEERDRIRSERGKSGSSKRPRREDDDLLRDRQRREDDRDKRERSRSRTPTRRADSGREGNRDRESGTRSRYSPPTSRTARDEDRYGERGEYGMRVANDRDDRRRDDDTGRDGGLHRRDERRHDYDERGRDEGSRRGYDGRENGHRR